MLADVKALGKSTAGSVASLVGVEQKFFMLSHCHSLVQFKHASSAQHASLLGLQHDIAGQLVTVRPVHQNLHGTHTRYSLCAIQACGWWKGCFLSVALLSYMYTVRPALGLC